MTSILFVCTGNICRSPTAEGVLRHKLVERGLDHLISTASAGISGYHIGHPPDSRTIDIARQRGYDLSRLRARQVQESDFENFDLILAMDQSHYAALMRQAPDAARERIALFLDYSFASAEFKDVPDPYYGSMADFVHVLDLIEHGIDGLLNTLGYNSGV